MSQILIDETKKALGYTEEQNKCEDCKHADKWEDQGGLWNWSCNYSNICSFTVRKHAHCGKFEKRNKS